MGLSEVDCATQAAAAAEDRAMDYLETGSSYPETGVMGGASAEISAGIQETKSCCAFIRELWFSICQLFQVKKKWEHFYSF